MKNTMIALLLLILLLFAGYLAMYGAAEAFVAFNGWLGKLMGWTYK